MNYKIWYSDGASETVADMTDNEWARVSDGIIFVRKYGWRSEVFMGLDYYWFEDGEMMYCIESEKQGYLDRPGGVQNMKSATHVGGAIWQTAHDEALTP